MNKLIIMHNELTAEEFILLWEVSIKWTDGKPGWEETK